MQCPRCRRDNPAGSKFCLECGTKLSLVCAACGSELPGGAKFCNECGRPVGTEPAPAAGGKFASPESYTPRHLAERILTLKDALEGERKLVTVLFADMKGSMELLADRDPEEARTILEPVLELMMEAVHRYEGTVNQVMGDGIMALFGAPLAHEDHAVRACYAALRMQEAVGHHAAELRRARGVDVQIRVGLNSGEVVVGSIGGDLRMDYTAVGQTTHLASRLEQLARPGASLLAADTLRLVEGYVQAKSLGLVPVKGLTTPIEIFELAGGGVARRRFEAAALRGLTRFVGRQMELAVLARALEQARAGHGQVVAPVGEAGVGKSRLIWEFTHSHYPQGCLVLQSGAVSYGKATPYLPVIDLLRAYFHLETTDDPRKTRENVIGRLLALDRTLESLLAPLLALLDVPVDEPAWMGLDPVRRRQRSLDAVKRLLLRESHVQPVIVVCEDLHWIDAQAQAVLDSLVESLPAAHLLLLVNYRPEYQHSWGTKTYYTQLHLDPLPPETADALLQDMMGDDPSLAPLKALLIDRTEGNPFFLEESVRALTETGVLEGRRGGYQMAKPIDEIQVPPTVQAVLAARIDLLPPEDKRLLQSAAVIGKDVSFRVLTALADTSPEEIRRRLIHLQSAEFLYETRLFPDLEYSFKHALTHDVAYGSLLHERRRALHARVMEAIERIHSDRLDERLDKLAYHALRGEVWDRAVAFFRRAGTAAATRIAYPDAVACYQQALAALRRLPDDLERRQQAADLHFELARSLYAAGLLDRAMDTYRDAEKLAAALGDDHRVARVCTGLAYLLGSEADHHGSIEAGERALSLSAQVADPALQIWTSVGVAREYFAVGAYERGIERARAAVDALQLTPTNTRFGSGTLLPPVGSRTWLALCLASIGQFGQAVTWAQSAIEFADKAEDPQAQVWANYTLGRIHCMRGHFEPALSLLERATALSERGRFPIYHPRVLAALGTVYTVRGRPGEGLALLERAAAEGEANRILYGHAMVLTQLAEAQLTSSPDKAEGTATRALEVARQHGERGNEAWAVYLLGQVAALRPPSRDEETMTQTTRAMALAAELQMRPLIAHCHRSLATLYRRANHAEEAGSHLAAATQMYLAMDMPFWCERATAELGDQRGDASENAASSV
jgi:class 3 adenylate cyclase/tetratricopeptide (TPR) repeat protein